MSRQTRVPPLRTRRTVVIRVAELTRRKQRLFPAEAGRNNPFHPGSNLAVAFEMSVQGTTLDTLRKFSASCSGQRTHSMIRQLRAGTARGFHWIVREEKGRFKIILVG